MKKIFMIFISLFCFLQVVNAEDVTVYLFHWNSCQHCQHEKQYLSTIDDPSINIKMYEVTEDSEIYTKVKRKLNIKDNGVPLTIIGSDYILGFNNSTKIEIEKTIDLYKENKHCDPVKLILGGKEIDKCLEKNNEFKNIDLDNNEKEEVEYKSISIFGKEIKFNPKEVSLPFISLFIGFVDGFNPCAMWVLIFLISMLMGMKNKKKMIILGITFLVTSALVYLVFMLGLLTITNLLIGTFFKYILAVIAIAGGIINLKSYIKSLNKNIGCQVTNIKKRNKIIEKIKNIIHEKKFIVSFIGIVLLAISVNFVELLCSSGLPTVFISILSINELSNIQYAIYILLYILMFMLDDIVIFLIAVLTLKVTGISNKYTKYSHLIGGILMMLIGILMIFKIEWLMFNF